MGHISQIMFYANSESEPVFLIFWKFYCEKTI